MTSDTQRERRVTLAAQPVHLTFSSRYSAHPVGGATEDRMSEPLSLFERMQLVAELDARVTRNPAPHPSLPATPGPGSNVAYVSKEENDRLVRQAMVMGLGRFQVR